MSQIIIDFDIIETGEPKYLKIMDVSSWEYSYKKPSYVSIILPGSKEPLVRTFKKNSTNVFNSHTLGITCFTNDCKDEEYTNLEDGIYTICVKSHYEGIEKKRYYLKTDIFEILLRKLIIKNGLEYDEKDKIFRDDIFQIKWYLDTAKSWASEGDTVKSKRFFNKAKDMLNTIENCNK